MSRSAKLHRVLLVLSLIYVAVVGVAMVGRELVPYGCTPELRAHGCYLESSLVAMVRCEGEWWLGLVEYVLNLPMLIMMYTAFGVGSLIDGEPGTRLRPLLYAMALWTPMAYLLWRAVRVMRESNERGRL